MLLVHSAGKGSEIADNRVVDDENDDNSVDLVPF